MKGRVSPPPQLLCVMSFANKNNLVHFYILYQNFHILMLFIPVLLKLSDVTYQLDIFSNVPQNSFHIRVLVHSFHFLSNCKYFYLLYHITCKKKNIKIYRKIFCIFIFILYVIYIMIMWNWELAIFWQSIICVPALWVALCLHNIENVM